MNLSVCESELIRLSQIAGMRPDWVQAGGGNTSVKDGDCLLIKASGRTLAELSPDRGIARLSLAVFWEEFLHFGDLASATQKSLNKGSERPSIETFLHVQMQKVTLHIHPAFVCSILMHPDYENILKPLFPDALFLKYCTPGKDLGLALIHGLKDRKDQKTLVFLQNHGVIFSGPDVDSVLEMGHDLDSKLLPLLKFEIPVSRFDIKVLGLVSKVYACFENPVFISPITDSLILGVFQSSPNLLYFPPFSPDILVYCGPKPLNSSLNRLKQDLMEFRLDYGLDPRILICEDNLFVVGQNAKKAKEIEDVLRFFCFCLLGARSLERSKNQPSESASLISHDGLMVLSPKEIEFLSNWESEKYRRNLGDK